MNRPSPLKRLASLGVRSATIDRVAEGVSAAENARLKEYELRDVALADIQIWADQPRRTTLQVDDVIRGSIPDTDRYQARKESELEKIISLALSQCEHGMLNAPLAYALPGRRVHLLGGQRRTMAAIFAALHTRVNDDGECEIRINPEPDLAVLETQRITVKVYLRKPDMLRMSKIGIVDNVQREDLPMGDRVQWLMTYVEHKKEVNPRAVVTWREISDSIGVSRSQAYQWLAILHARDDVTVQKVIQDVIAGKTHLARAVDIAKSDPDERVAIYEQVQREMALRSESPESEEIADPPEVAPKQRLPNANPGRVSLGATGSLNALRTLVLRNVEEPEERKKLEQIDWSDPREVKKGFTAFLRYWESKYGD